MSSHFVGPTEKLEEEYRRCVDDPSLSESHKDDLKLVHDCMNQCDSCCFPCDVMHGAECDNGCQYRRELGVMIKESSKK